MSIFRLQLELKGREVGVVKPGDTDTNLHFGIVIASLCITQVLGVFYF